MPPPPRQPTAGQRLAEAEATLDALRRGEIDAIVGRDEVMLLRLRETEAALQASEARNRTLLDTIDQGFCVIEVRFDESDRGVDYRYLEANTAFAANTGIVDPIGRWMREIYPDHEQSWFEIYGEIARTGRPRRFENAARALGRIYDVYAFRVDDPAQRRVAVLFNDITARKAAEVALRRSEERWTAAIEHFAQGAIIADSNEQVIYWNPAARRLHGFSSPDDGKASLDDLGRTFQLWTADGLRQLLPDEWPLRRIVRGELLQHVELRLRRLDQHWERVVAYSGSVVQTPSGETLLFLSVYDLTEQRAAEAALRASEERFRRLADVMPQLVWTAAVDGAIDYYNSQVVRYTGIQREHDGRWSWQPVLHPDDVERTTRAWHRAVDEGQPYECEHRVRMADGTFRWHLSRAHFVHWPGGAQWFGTATDIHDLKLAQEQLHEREQRFRAMANTAPAMLWISDANHLCTFLSRGWSEYTGRPEAEGAGLGWIEAVHPDDRRRVRDVYLDASRRHVPFAIDYRLHTKSGEFRWATDAGRPRFDERGEFVGYIGSVFDVHERKEAEEALREADRRKDRFLAMLSHELRNPLAPIRTAARILASPKLTDEQLGWSRRVIQRQVEHMAGLLDDLLDVARITQGKIELRRERVGLASVVDAAVEAARPLVESKRHRLSVRLPDPDPALDVDPMRASQIISNLLTNAAKYTDSSGEICVVAAVEPDSVSVRVTDNGIGIAPPGLERIFEMFAQLESGRDRSDGGLGIGLALARGLAELHGGTLDAESAGPGRGSTFTLRLPRAAHAATGGESRRRVEEATPRRVLVADDNRDAADSLAMLLGAMGHEVEVAYEGHAALALLREFRPDVALLDIGMPGLDGYEIARRLREQPSLRQTRLIALTGWGQMDDKARAAAAGFDLHLTKPADIGAIEAILSLPLDESAASAESG
ncbi:MAG TPA: PAS domain S-box protein [Steroidobacteraceae bacterium]|jgi:PAS domain S-box-containing protein|nr:PAS domain S-box protein [Steroidobacteraceae bacterium]